LHPPNITQYRQEKFYKGSINFKKIKNEVV
jgi:hypothetical protein